MMTPVALMTSSSDVAEAGNEATATRATSDGEISPDRARRWAATTTAFTAGRPSRVAAAASSGKASRTSVAGMSRRASRPSPGDNAFVSIATPSAPESARLTQYAHGGGCACKIPPGELEAIVGTLRRDEPLSGAYGDLLVGVDDGDDAAVVANPDGGPAYVLTTDFFTPVVDDAYDWGRIAATNALSDVYAMGGRPVVAVNLLGWPREKLPMDLAAQVLNGGLDVARAAGCHLVGGHSVDDPEPKYGLAVTGIVDPLRMLRIDKGRAGLPLTLTKPLGIGVLNSRHKATGVVFPQAITAMTTSNRAASEQAVLQGWQCATDITGFGLLGHTFKLARASGVTAVIDASAVPYLDDARQAAQDGYISGGTRRNLDWVRPHTDLGAVDELEALLLADAQTSGGLLIAGEVPGGTVVGELISRGEHAVVVRK
jgi:selenide, water dikinase